MGRDLPGSEPMYDEAGDETDDELGYDADDEPGDEADDELGDDRAIDAEPSMPPSGNGNSDEE